MIELILSWALYTGAADRLEATAFVRAPVRYVCEDPAEGLCVLGYVETWREVRVLTVSMTSARWNIELPNGAVAYASVRACRGECCSP